MAKAKYSFIEASIEHLKILGEIVKGRRLEDIMPKSELKEKITRDFSTYLALATVHMQGLAFLSVSADFSKLFYNTI